MAIYSLDTETYKYDRKEGVYRPVLNTHEFTIGCVINEKEERKLFTTREFMRQHIKDECAKKNKHGKRTFWYAHNHEYDWYAIWKGDLLNKDIKYICYNPFIAIYKEKNYFLDTMAFYRMSLETLGTILGYKKLEMPKEIKEIKQLVDYVERDTEIVMKAIKELKKKINKLGFNPRKLLTAGQLAMTSFLTYCRREGIDKEFTETIYTGINKNGKKTFKRQIIKSKYAKQVREAFRGGMNICFQIGKFEWVKLIDANGEYAKMMTIMDFPDLSTETYNEKTEIGMLIKYIANQIGVARVKIKAPKTDRPFLPVRFTRYTVYEGNKILRGTWTFRELEEAIELGYEIIECEWSIRWKKAKMNPLKNFIEHLYEMEKKCETIDEKKPIKLIRNNLYGKFSQYKKNKDYVTIPRHKVREYVEKGYEPVSTMEDKYICAKEEGEYDPSYVNPIISAMITAEARIFLYKEMLKVPKEDLIYCDTDSIAFKGNHLDKFKVGKELGEWKLEAEGEAKFLGEKRYYIKDKAKCSGLMKREISKEIIEREENVQTKRMIGLLTGITKGRMEEVGTFEEYVQEMKPHNKLMLITPEIIDEVKEYAI